MPRLRFAIEGDPNNIALPTYSAATSRVVQILRELDTAISGEGGASTNWYIAELSKNGNLSIEVESRVRPAAKNGKQPRKDVSMSVADSFVTTFENIQTRGISPPYLSEYGLEKLQSMMSLLHRNGAKEFVATLVDKGRSVTVNEAAERTLRQLLPPTRTFDGSVEGRLETISVRGGKKFIVYHSISRKAVTCMIESDSDLEIAKRALGKKVSVSGVVSVNVKSEPLRVEVMAIRILGEGKLPRASDLTGSDPGFTGDLSTEEYIRSIRIG